MCWLRSLTSACLFGCSRATRNGVLLGVGCRLCALSGGLGERWLSSWFGFWFDTFVVNLRTIRCEEQGAEREV